MFIKQFPLKEGYDTLNELNISEYKNLVDVSNNFKCEFYNAGIMYDGGIYTVKTKLDYNLVYPLRNIRLESKVENKYFFNENQVKKFAFLKGAKKV